MRQALDSDLSLILSLAHPRSFERESELRQKGWLVRDWNAVLDRAAALGIGVPVLSHARAILRSVMPEEAYARATIEETRLRAKALEKTLQVVDLSRRLSAAGVETIVLKGPSVGISAYGDPSLRPFSDIDLLVRHDSVAAASILLADLGYRPLYSVTEKASLVRGGRALEFSGQSVKVELHTTLMERYLLFSIPEDELWSQSFVIECGNSTVRVLNRAHEFVFLCAHAAKHEWERVRWALDLAHLSERLDATGIETIASLARSTHAARIVALASRVTALLFDGRSFPEPLDSLARALDTRACLAMCAKRLTASGREGRFTRVLRSLHPVLQPSYFWIRARERSSDRVRVILQLSVDALT